MQNRRITAAAEPRAIMDGHHLFDHHSWDALCVLSGVRLVHGSIVPDYVLLEFCGRVRVNVPEGADCGKQWFHEWQQSNPLRHAAAGDERGS